MAYYPFPATYQPFQPQPVYPTPMLGQNVPQAPAMAQQPQQQAQAAPSGIMWVRSFREALEYPVAPNSAVALWDQNAPAVYLKTADASGKPSTKVYDLVERPETPVETTQPQGNQEHAYASKSDVEALTGIVKGYSGVISQMQGEIDRLNADLTNLTRAKKPAGKKEGTENE